ncbi:bifunctional 4-hydroxy-2-oxoglutarate aldolase/2-dehydro-3-deoxy-phosphogluconate aldolase [Chamaesiphon sp. VAR_48_metabat_135_sub]|uniref:bifunctional 4-hydroxy-2-oxoglutarate aldolase/2-dehydro-3-deoxy-phosphogluconate aldolase n=1 Tax=Chamaesiphon sp. VAR_48_metabat_135_sub TaxID=2964699 RepID=UPI00286B8833|nr:bifunctional 4-hydroxy-2-oxoglutarate aldolase/2-dehydro-3-deoxy-phosphogluconate aldolase [Chamaesiphon sp. VAR_48_metabat_135_sub]
MQSYREDWLKFVRQERIIAVIRSTDLRIGLKMAQAAAAGGIKLIEITANSDRSWELIELLRAELPDCSIGTGTVLSLADLRNAIACGAEYIFTPHVDLSLIQAATSAEIPIVSGALTPTEIITAWQAGATAVKVFPIQAVGGVSYLQVLQGPIDRIPLIPTGGVTVTNAHDFLAAGAVAVGLAGSLFPQAEIIREDWQSIRDRANYLTISAASIGIKFT